MPLSIPSPPDDWKLIPIGRWLHWLFPGIAESQVPTIHTYAIIMVAGIIAATIWTSRRLTRRGAEPGVVLDVIIWAVPIGLVGARAYHVLTHPNDYFGPTHDFVHVFYIWEGGNAIFGSLLAGAVGAFIGCRITGLRFWSFADALAPAMLLAQAIGRLGNYVNHELFGQPTDLPWGLEIEPTNPAYPVGLPAGTLFHPTFLYEIIWNLIGIAVLLLAERSFRVVKRNLFGFTIPVLIGAAQPRLQWGKLWALYLIWYGIGRVWFESIRVDPSEVYLGLRSNVWAAIFAIVLGIVLFLVQRSRHPGSEPSPYRPGREWKPEGAVDSGETYSDSDEPSEELATSGTGSTTSS
ncbi:MAG: prolipoprotein diacylglyceryl transferase [Salinibacterium sp.]|nr:MAG: prolipoprotein diacylglyceryl transferase [Salinibacterium sp.]